MPSHSDCHLHFDLRLNLTSSEMMLTQVKKLINVKITDVIAIGGYTTMMGS
jgi:hypothetical protein